MKRFFPPRPAKHGRPDLEHIDAVYLREMGLNPDDFHEPRKRRWDSLLFAPFRDFRKR